MSIVESTKGATGYGIAPPIIHPRVIHVPEIILLESTPSRRLDIFFPREDAEETKQFLSPGVNAQKRVEETTRSFSFEDRRAVVETTIVEHSFLLFFSPVWFSRANSRERGWWVADKLEKTLERGGLMNVSVKVRVSARM